MLRFLMWWDEASTTFTTLPSWSPPFAFVEEIFHKGKFWSLQNTRQPNGNVNQADGYPSSEETELCGPELVTHISCFCYTWPHCSGCFSHHCSWVSFYLPLVIFFFCQPIQTTPCTDQPLKSDLCFGFYSPLCCCMWNPITICFQIPHYLMGLH